DVCEWLAEGVPEIDRITDETGRGEEEPSGAAIDRLRAPLLLFEIDHREREGVDDRDAAGRRADAAEDRRGRPAFFVGEVESADREEEVGRFAVPGAVVHRVRVGEKQDRRRARDRFAVATEREAIEKP